LAEAPLQYTRTATILSGALSVTVSLPQRRLFPQRLALLFIFALVGLFAMVLVAMAGLAVNRWIVRPFRHIMGEMAGVGANNLTARLTATGSGDVDGLVRGINGMLDRLEDYSRRVFASQQRLYEAELHHQKMQMCALKSQIDAHFLYNSLLSVTALASQGKVESVDKIAQGIAEMLRYANSPEEEVDVFEEMGIVRTFINIMNIRFRGKFRVTYLVEDELCGCGILKLLLQPLVENALIHGLEEKAGLCALIIRGRRCPGGLRIEVEDNGAGIPPETLARLRHEMQGESLPATDGRHGIALANASRRIRLRYGEPYGIRIESEYRAYTKAVMEIPAVPRP
jgi:two-component system sensor histidine kinase YesM